MSYEITGKIIKISPLQEFDSGFKKRGFVIQTNERYPQQIKLELFKDKCSLLDNYNQGDTVTASFNLRGNEYKGKYYVNLQAWKIEGQPTKSSTPQNENQTEGEQVNDLPF